MVDFNYFQEKLKDIDWKKPDPKDIDLLLIMVGDLKLKILELEYNLLQIKGERNGN